jgi:hypothetical protein
MNRSGWLLDIRQVAGVAGQQRKFGGQIFVGVVRDLRDEGVFLPSELSWTGVRYAKLARILTAGSSASATLRYAGAGTDITTSALRGRRVSGESRALWFGYGDR